MLRLPRETSLYNERIRKVLGLLGKHAYNKTDEDGGEALVIE